MQAWRIETGIFMIGGPDITHDEDAAAFLVDCGPELTLIDCGAGKSAKTLEANIRSAGYDPRNLTNLILTHAHVDHIGGARYFQETYHCRIIAHELDAPAIESGDPKKTAAAWYGIRLPTLPIDLRLQAELTVLTISNTEIHCLHIPGHTPGSLAIYLDRSGKRVLFGQDIHGPFHHDFDSDISAWRISMEKLIQLNADILCEGHFGMYSPQARVKKYIQDYLDRYAHQ